MKRPLADGPRSRARTISVPKMRIARPNLVAIVMSASRTSGPVRRVSGVAGSVIGRRCSLRPGRDVWSDGRQGRIVLGRREPLRGLGEPVAEPDLRPVAEDVRRLVDASDVPAHVSLARWTAEHREWPPDGGPDRVRQLVDRRLHAGPGLEQLAGNLVRRRVDGGHHGRREIADEDEVSGLLAIAVDGHGLADQRCPQP